MKPEIPQLHIRRARLLEDVYPPDSDIDRRVEHLCKTHLPLVELQELLQLEYSQDVIDVYVTSGKSISDPLLVGIKGSKPVEQILFHELIHRLLSQNKQGVDEDVVSPQLYPSESKLCSVHVVVQAIHMYFYKNIFGEEFLKVDRDSSTNPHYHRAWEIIDKEGYEEVISSFRLQYTNSRAVES